MKIQTKKLVYISVLTALCTVFNIVAIPMGGNNFLSFVYVPSMIAGMFFGPLGGFTAGFVGDLIGGFVAPKGGAYLPLIGIASGLLGAIPGLVFKIKKLNDIDKVLISFLLILVVCTAGLNTFALWSAFSAGKTTFWVYMWSRFPLQVLVCAANMSIMVVLVRTNLLSRIMGSNFQKAEN